MKSNRITHFEIAWWFTQLSYMLIRSVSSFWTWHSFARGIEKEATQTVSGLSVNQHPLLIGLHTEDIFYSQCKSSKTSKRRYLSLPTCFCLNASDKNSAAIFIIEKRDYRILLLDFLFACPSNYSVFIRNFCSLVSEKVVLHFNLQDDIGFFLLKGFT